VWMLGVQIAGSGILAIEVGIGSFVGVFGRISIVYVTDSWSFSEVRPFEKIWGICAIA